MSRIAESELILPSLYLLSESTKKECNTTDLINWIRKLLNPENEDLEILRGRNDDKFSQKVRNLKSHETLEKSWYATYNKSTNKFRITKKWEKYLKDNDSKLKLIIAEENLIDKYSSSVSNYFIEFEENISKITKLTAMSVDETLKQHLFWILYSSIITSLETYLFDAIKFNITIKEQYLINFVEMFKKYQEEKITYNSIFKKYNWINQKVNQDLANLLYHNLGQIKEIYKFTFDIDFQDIAELMSAIVIRHDLVHRNGKMKNGKYHKITKTKILSLCKETKKLVENIEKQLKEKNEIA